MNKWLIWTLMILILLASSKTLSVTYSGGILHVPEDYSTIQAAINAASPGDTIMVASGIYKEEVNINKAVEVLGSGASTTFIDGTGVVLASAGLVKITAAGDVTFSGFTVQHAPAAGVVNFGILSQSGVAGVTYTISHNNIYGTNDPSNKEDYGFYSQSDSANVVFTHNLITQTGANNIVFELHTGTTEISYSTLEAGIAGAADAIFFMTYDGIDVTALQNVSYNTFNMGTGSVFDYAHRSGAISINTPGAAYGVTDAKFTNVVIQGNTINNLKSYRRGIGFWNGGGGGGGIIAPLVKSNTITGTTGSTESYGIFFVATGSAPNAATNPTVINNMIYNCAYGIYLRTAGCALGAQIHYNNVAGNTVGLDNTVGPSDVDARFNWWGSATGPTYSSNPGGTGDAISSNVDYSPWLENPFEVTPRTYHVNPTGTIQEAIDEASPGDTIMLSAGTYTEGPQFVINKNLAIRGADASTTIIKAAGDTGSSGDSRGWFLIGDGVTFNLEDVTIDGSGHSIYKR